MDPFVLITKLVNKMCQHFCFMIWQLSSSSLALDDYFILICCSIKYLGLLIPTTIIIFRSLAKPPNNWVTSKLKPNKEIKKLLILTVLLDIINILGNILGDKLSFIPCWHSLWLLTSAISEIAFNLFHQASLNFVLKSASSSSFCSWVFPL